MYPQAQGTSTTEAAPWLDVELTTEEMQDALMEGKRRKWNRDESRREHERRARFRAELLRPWNSDEYMEFLKYRAVHHLRMIYSSGGVKMQGLQIDADNSKLLKLLCLYFTNDPAFEAMVLSERDGVQYKGDLNKGILLYGPPGTGKSAILKLFAVNQRCSYHVYNVPKICEDYQRDGKLVIDVMSSPTEVPEDSKYFYQRELGKCFDDVLREEGEKKFYGNTTNVMSNIFFNLSENGTSHWKVHATLNYPMSVIAEAYGDHIRSRFYQMFNFIEVKGRDRRKD
jgi:Cdc6-like AAA superfamily ATPase